MSDDKALLEEFRRRLDGYVARIEWHRARLGQITSRTVEEFDMQMMSLRQELEQSREEAGRLAASGGKAWKDLKAGFDKAWSELRGAFETATTHFQ